MARMLLANCDLNHLLRFDAFVHKNPSIYTIPNLSRTYFTLKIISECSTHNILSLT